MFVGVKEASRMHKERQNEVSIEREKFLPPAADPGTFRFGSGSCYYK